MRIIYAHLNQEELLAGLHDTRVESILDIAQEQCMLKFPVDWEDTGAYDRNVKNQETQ